MWTDSRLLDLSCPEGKDSTVITDDKILAAVAVRKMPDHNFEDKITTVWFILICI